MRRKRYEEGNPDCQHLELCDATRWCSCDGPSTAVGQAFGRLLSDFRAHGLVMGIPSRAAEGRLSVPAIYLFLCLYSHTYVSLDSLSAAQPNHVLVQDLWVRMGEACGGEPAGMLCDEGAEVELRLIFFFRMQLG